MKGSKIKKEAKKRKGQRKGRKAERSVIFYFISSLKLHMKPSLQSIR
jgi:hypothetical protein